MKNSYSLLSFALLLTTEVFAAEIRQSVVKVGELEVLEAIDMKDASGADIVVQPGKYPTTFTLQFFKKSSIFVRKEPNHFLSLTTGNQEEAKLELDSSPNPTNAYPYNQFSAQWFATPKKAKSSYVFAREKYSKTLTKAAPTVALQECKIDKCEDLIRTPYCSPILDGEDCWKTQTEHCVRPYKVIGAQYVTAQVITYQDIELDVIQERESHKVLAQRLVTSKEYSNNSLMSHTACVETK